MHFIFYLTSATFFFKNNAAQNTLEIDYNLQNGAIQLFMNFIQDPGFAVQLLNHGCWCSKFNIYNSDQAALGGSTTSDEIDLICKKWAQARKCSKNQCELLPFPGDTYQIDYTTGVSDAVCPDTDDCLSLSCQIDMFYMNQILDFQASLSTSFTPDTTPICELSGGSGSSNCKYFETTALPTATTSQVTIISLPFENPLEQLCRQQPMDLVFVMDGSGSVGASNFQQQIDFMKDVTAYMTIGASDTRVGLVQFSSVPQLEFSYLDDATNLENSFDAAQWSQGGTNTGAAIQFAYDSVIQPNARSGVRVTMVVITDGFSFDNVQVPSDSNKAAGVDMFSVGYFGANTDQLEKIASDPKSDFMYQGSTIADLLSITDELVTVICSQPATRYLAV